MTIRSLASVLLLLVVCASVATALTYPCTFGAYNLGGLIKTTGDYTGSDGSYDYKMNVCADSNAGAGCTDANYAICQYNPSSTGVLASLGKFTTTAPAQPVWAALSTGESGVQYTFTNGDICWIAGRQQTRTVITQFRCTPGAAADPTFQISEDQTTCTFTIIHKSGAACPGAGGGGDSPSGLGGGSVFLIILCCIIPVYIAVGCVFNIKKHGTKPGPESMPNREFWTDLPGLVRDGARYTWNMTRSGCKSGKGEAYTQL